MRRSFFTPQPLLFSFFLCFFRAIASETMEERAKPVPRRGRRQSRVYFCPISIVLKLNFFTDFHFSTSSFLVRFAFFKDKGSRRLRRGRQAGRQAGRVRTTTFLRSTLGWGRSFPANFNSPCTWSAPLQVAINKIEQSSQLW